MDISNRTLGLLLVAAIVVSVGGTLMSLNQLETISPTGFASSDTGTVTLTITQTASLTLDDDTIDFGSCTTDTEATFTTYNGSLAAAGENNSLCSNSVGLPDSMTIRNSGTVDISVTMNASANGSTLFNSPSSKWYYSMSNGAGTSCNGTLQSSWTAVDDPLNNLAVCDQLLTYSRNGDTASTVVFDFGAHVAMGGYNAATTLDLIFEATAV